MVFFFLHNGHDKTRKAFEEANLKPQISQQIKVWLSLMFDGHTKHSPDEMKKMFEDIIVCGEKYNVKIPYLKGSQKDIT